MIEAIELHGVIDETGYACVDEAGHGFLIDPGAEPERIAALVKERGWTIEGILLTHGHFDHIGAADVLRRVLQVPIYAHEKGTSYLRDPRRNLSARFGGEIRLTCDILLAEGNTVDTASGSISLQVISTPGHTEDSVTYYEENLGVAFVGDTIFAGGIGRTDFPGGDRDVLVASIFHAILLLPPETVLYSGHSEPTTVARECRRYGVE